MGYGIFGQKITGIRDIKTPPNGASSLSLPFQFFHKSRMLAVFVFKSKMLQVLRTSFWVLLRVLFRSTEEF